MEVFLSFFSLVGFALVVPRVEELFLWLLGTVAISTILTAFSFLEGGFSLKIFWSVLGGKRRVLTFGGKGTGDCDSNDPSSQAAAKFFVIKNSVLRTKIRVWYYRCGKTNVALGGHTKANCVIRSVCTYPYFQGNISLKGRGGVHILLSKENDSLHSLKNLMIATPLLFSTRGRASQPVPSARP